MRWVRPFLALVAVLLLGLLALFSAGIESRELSRSGDGALATVEGLATWSGLATSPGSATSPGLATRPLGSPPATTWATPAPSAAPLPGAWATVTRIVDGDTIAVQIDGRPYRVRYIGIDTPEFNDCYYQQAKSANARLVLGQRVRLVKDVSETDRYGRLLRYVYVGPLFVNAELVRQGYALASTYPPDVAYAGLFVRLQREARQADAGLWSGCATTPTAMPGANEAGMPSSVHVRIAPECSQFNAPGDDNKNLGQEYVCLENRGATAVDLGGWRVVDRALNTYRFAPLMLPAGATLRIHTGAGTDTATDLYWGQKQAVWANTGDTVSLYIRGGALLDQYTY